MRWLLILIGLFAACETSSLVAAEFTPPNLGTNVAPGAPLIYEHSPEAGPDETFLVVGTNLTTNVLVWGQSPENPAGQWLKPRVQWLTNQYLAVTLPERAYDGLTVFWVTNQFGYSRPCYLNTPQIWWATPDTAVPGETVRLFGRNLAQRPDFTQAIVTMWNEKHNIDPKPVEVLKTGKYCVEFRVPPLQDPGEYRLAIVPKDGGMSGWGFSKLNLVPLSKPGKVVAFQGQSGEREIQKALDALATEGGGTLQLPPGKFGFSGSLRIPAGVTLAGAGREKTSLILSRTPNAPFARLNGAGWDQAPGAIHSPGDKMIYEVKTPHAGEWIVWMRYATDMAPWKQPGVSGNMTLGVVSGTPVPLMNLTNTGGFGTFRWAKAATLSIPAGFQQLCWQNVKGGGISLDAFCFTQDPAWTPDERIKPTNSASLLVLQGEDCVQFLTKEGNLPRGDRPAVWLAGDDAGLTDLTVHGNSLVNQGIAVADEDPLRWVSGCRVLRVRVTDGEGKQGENCGLFVRKAERGTFRENELWGRAPIFIRGARKSEFALNRLVSVTRYGGNAEAAILGRTDTIEECVVENNLVASPPGAEAGGPTARRLLWFSTGHGSVTHNWIAGNGIEGATLTGGDGNAGMARFGGVAGTDQNVGEMILFEANHRTAYFGPITSADANSVTLPATIPATPDNRLGSVERKQLAHDAQGRETPFWPPDVDDGSEEPPLTEYYVTIMSGRGQGQTRRVVSRSGERLLLAGPWQSAPREGSVVVVGTGYYQNLIVGNHTPDGMTGIQLWISCMENVVAGNTIARQRKPGIFLYANGTTLASSMPRTWNRGISPLFWNVAEGNRIEECSAGALVTSGDEADLPVEFPRALGNVVRHNSFLRNRTDGVVLGSRSPAPNVKDTAASITGTLVEFNVVRDARTAYHAGHSTDATVFRRNHAYFWYPVSNSTNQPVAFKLDDPGTTASFEYNSIEGIHGNHDNSMIDLQTPAGPQRLPNQ
jgi:hypothetical protein